MLDSEFNEEGNSVYLSLLTLPDLITAEILKCLDSKTLRNLRLVNHLTKSWVESDPKLLAKLKFKINDETRLVEIVNSAVPWNNFSITSSNFDGLLESAEFITFLKTYGQFIKIFRVRSSGLNSQNVTAYMECFGPQLESLCIESTASQSGDVNGPTAIIPEQITTKILPNLKHLEYMDFGKMTDTAAGIFKGLLKISPNLVEIKIAKLFWTTVTELCKVNALNNIYNPLIEYLENRKKFPQATRLNRLVIDLIGRSSARTSAHMDPTIYPLEKPTLLKMVELCNQIGAKLLNVPSTALPTSNNSANLSSKQVFAFGNVILSVAVLNASEGLYNITIPSTTLVNVKMCPARGQDFTRFELHGLVKIMNLRLTRSPVDAIVGLQNFYQNVFNVPRPSLRELIIVKNNSEDLANGFQISTNFPNLKKLELVRWDSTEEHFHNLLTGLPLLESLSFRSCVNCTDAALLGPDFENPLIRGLKNLKHLTLDDTKITDLVFQNAICYIKLKSFEWQTNEDNENVVQVTFQNGISTLGSIENGFRDSVEKFDCKIPEDGTHENMYALIDQFPYLKVSNIHARYINKPR